MSAIFAKLVLFITLITMLIQVLIGNLCGGKNPPETTTEPTSAVITETTTKTPSTVPVQTETTTEETTAQSTTTEPSTEPSSTVPDTTTAVTAPTTTKAAITTKSPAAIEFGTRFNSASQEKTLEFGGKSINVFNGVDAAADGGFVACGISTSTDGIFADLGVSGYVTNFSFILKYDSNLNIKWIKAIGFDKTITGSASITLEDVAVLDDGSIVAVGYSSAKDVAFNSETEGSVDAVIYKFTSDGELVFTKSFGGTKTDSFYCVDRTDTGFAVGGSTHSHDYSFNGIPETDSSAIIINLDNDGNVLWNKYLNGDKGGVIKGISTDNDGNIFVSCITDSTTGNFAGFSELEAKLINTVVIKYNYAGEYQWYYAVASSAKDNFGAVAADDKGGCVIAGYYEYLSYNLPDGTLEGVHNCGGTDALVISLNKSGSVNWMKTIAGYDNDYITDIDKTTGGYAVCGYTYSSNRDFSSIGNKGNGDAFVAFLTPGGNTAELLSMGGSRTDSATCIAVNKNGIAAMLGKTVSNDGSFEGQNTHLTDGYIELFKKIFNDSEPFTCFAAKYSTTIQKF